MDFIIEIEFLAIKQKGIYLIANNKLFFAIIQIISVKNTL